METFVSTSDGRYPCLKYKGNFYYCSPDELAAQLGIGAYAIEIDPVQRAKDIKEERRRAVLRYNASLPERWGF